MSYLERLAKSVRRFTPEDRPMLDAFAREMYGPGARQSDPGYFDWLYEENPRARPGESSLWILERSGKVVGQQGGLPTPLYVEGSVVRAHWAIDLMVRPEWRMRGAGPLVSGALADSGDVTMAIGVSEDAAKAFGSAGWSDLGKLPLFVRPLCASCLFADRGAPWWLVEVVKKSPLEAVGFSATAIAAVLTRVSSTRFERVEAFDERVDGLWARVAPELSVASRRDLAYLRWRFDHPTRRARYQRYYLVRGEQVLGYVVTCIDEWHEMPIARIVDHLAPSLWIAPLVGSAVDVMHAQEAVAVFWEGLDRRSIPTLRALGFLAGPAATTFMSKSNLPREATKAHLHDASQWFVTIGDADRDT